MLEDDERLRARPRASTPRWSSSSSSAAPGWASATPSTRRPSPTTPNPDHGPRDFNEYLMPGPGDIAPYHVTILERPAPDGPFGGKGPGEMCANPVLPAVANAVFNAVGVRVDELPITPEKVLRGIRAQRRRAAAGAPRRAGDMALRTTVAGISSPEALADALRVGDVSRRRRASRRPAISRSRSASRCCSKARRASARPRPPRRSPAILGRQLIRLQCFEGIDAAAALYEWNYPRQMLAIRQAKEDQSIDIYRDDFLIERPMLTALRAPGSTVLLIDEIDRSDHEFEAFLLEFLSDFSISIPERGTLRAAERPVVVLTSNRTRELHEALRRRCVYHYIAYPEPEREAQIIMMRSSAVAESTARAVVAAVGRAAAGAAGEAAGRRRGGGLGRGRDRARAERRALAGGVPPRASAPPSRTRRTWRICAARRRHPDAACASSRRRARLEPVGRCRLPAPCARSSLSHAAARRTGLRSRRSRRRRSSRPWTCSARAASSTSARPRVATLAPHPEQRERFDALFDMHFLGALAEAGDEEWRAGRGDVGPGGQRHPRGADRRGGRTSPAAPPRRPRPCRRGASPSPTTRRPCAASAATLPAALPRRRGYRRARSRRGATVDLAGSLRTAIRHDGEVMTPQAAAPRGRARARSSC